MGRIFASRDGHIFQHYRTVPRPQTGRGYLLEQHGGAAHVPRNDALKARLVEALRSANVSSAQLEGAAASLSDAINKHDFQPSATSDKKDETTRFFVDLGVPAAIAKEVAERRAYHEVGADAYRALEDVADYLQAGPKSDYVVTPTGMSEPKPPPATNPELARVVDADGNEAPVAGEGAPPGKRTAFPLSFGIPGDPRRPDEATKPQPSAPPPDEPSAPPAVNVPSTGGDDMSSDDEGFASADEEFEPGVPTASSATGPVNVTEVPTRTIRDAAATLAPVATGIGELSPEQRAQLLQAVHELGRRERAVNIKQIINHNLVPCKIN